MFCKVPRASGATTGQLYTPLFRNPSARGDRPASAARRADTNGESSRGRILNGALVSRWKPGIQRIPRWIILNYTAGWDGPSNPKTPCGSGPKTPCGSGPLWFWSEGTLRVLSGEVFEWIAGTQGNPYGSRLGLV
jgi:hypothetical protein